MKISRHKKVQKYIKFYYNNYGFRQPYQVLLDGTFCFTARNEQISIRDQIPKYFSSDVKLLTTRCIIIETEKIAKKTHGALTVLKQFGIHECNHKEPIPGAKCILSMIGKRNDKHYILATQDRDLQEKLRAKPGVPLLYLHHKSPTLEKPSKASYEKANASQDGAALIPTPQNEMLDKIKKAFGITEETPDQSKALKNKKKKTHNPNPLSCKKKKSKDCKSHVKKQELDDKSKKIRKRNRKKLPVHLKEQLKSVI